MFKSLFIILIFNMRTESQRYKNCNLLQETHLRCLKKIKTGHIFRLPFFNPINISPVTLSELQLRLNGTLSFARAQELHKGKAILFKYSAKSKSYSLDTEESSIASALINHIILNLSS